MINVECIDVSLKLNLDLIEQWLKSTSENEGKSLGVVSIVLGTDEWLLDKNIKFLKHDFYTDIITFDYSEDSLVSGDLLISLERVYDNADDHNVSRETELMRVIVHGILHLIGYNDKSPKEAQIMRKKEDYYLSLL